MKDIVVKLPITSLHLWEIFLVATVFFILMSVILMFHWNYYGVKENPKVFIKGLFFSVGIIILFIALTLLSIYSVS